VEIIVVKKKKKKKMIKNIFKIFLNKKLIKKIKNNGEINVLKKKKKKRVIKIFITSKHSLGNL